jgi:hypothetical protein
LVFLREGEVADVAGGDDGGDEDHGEGEGVAERGRRDRGAAERAGHVHDAHEERAHERAEGDVHARAQGEEPHVLEVLQRHAAADRGEEERGEEEPAIDLREGLARGGVEEAVAARRHADGGDDEDLRHSLARHDEDVDRDRHDDAHPGPRARSARARCRLGTRGREEPREPRKCRVR